ncbi:Phage-related baseplate assembly protein [Fulvimarina manganoxydans]|uniref:Phage-related baseplate assembly protein n=1 Tax=Fulvimarina manganoxydans TaxID=937218 RepID=A0A1W2EJW9_9HYPH|nr:baseplate J/gp47 family protein [Fulvimarina manganoxydans]SMD10007.1 Phage-related baseplate assembly protein [Fulvimarina manganoxydans]
MTSAPSIVDVSRLPPPDAIEIVSAEAMIEAFLDRFAVEWEAERAIDPTLPEWTVAKVAANPIRRVGGRAWQYTRVLDRYRVNDAIRSVFVAFAKGSNLDAVAANQNVQRLLVRAATADTPAVYETDERLLLRYLFSFDRASAGSEGAYLYAAYSTVPAIGHAAVVGFNTHGRRGDTDVVVMGEAGALVSDAERAAISAAVRAPHIKPEAVSVAVLKALRVEYRAHVRVELPQGPDADLVRQQIADRIKAATDARTLIAGEVPDGLIQGAAYGPNVLSVADLNPIVIAPDAYSVPVCTEITVEVVVRS